MDSDDENYLEKNYERRTGEVKKNLFSPTNLRTKLYLELYILRMLSGIIEQVK